MEDSARRLFPIFSFSRAGYLPFHIARCYFLLWRAKKIKETVNRLPHTFSSYQRHLLLRLYDLYRRW